MHVTAGGPIAFAARRFGSRVVLRTTETTQTFTELAGTANRFGSGLRALGLRPGDRVAVLSHNRAEVVQVWLGLESHGFVRVVLHSHFDFAVHAALIERVQATAVVFDTRFAATLDGYRDRLLDVRLFIALGDEVPAWATSFGSVLAAGHPDDPAVDVDEESPVCVQPTTGTTGDPKPWTFTHRSWRAWMETNLAHLDTFDPDLPAVGPDDVGA